MTNAAQECVVCGDAAELLPLLGPVELVVADPPYAFDQMGADWLASNERKTTAKQTVSNLSSGMAFSAGQAAKARRGFLPFAVGIEACLVSGGFALIFAAPRLSHGFALALEDAGLAIREQLIWQHEGGQFKAASLRRFGADDGRVTPQPRPMFESIIVAQKLPNMTLSRSWQERRAGLMAARTLRGEVPTSILRFPKPDRKEREEGGKHPTQKPVALLEELIHRFSIAGQAVLDPFTGSGTTGVAALRLGRKFIGVERDPHFAAVAERRVAQNTPANERNER